jgi:hypothetical protein
MHLPKSPRSFLKKKVHYCLSVIGLLCLQATLLFLVLSGMLGVAIQRHLHTSRTYSYSPSSFGKAFCNKCILKRRMCSITSTYCKYTKMYLVVSPSLLYSCSYWENFSAFKLTFAIAIFIQILKHEIVIRAFRLILLASVW